MKIGRINISLVSTVQNHNQVGHDTTPACYGHTPKMKEHPDIALVYHSLLLVIFGNRECPHLQAKILISLGNNSINNPYWVMHPFEQKCIDKPD